MSNFERYHRYNRIKKEALLNRSYKENDKILSKEFITLDSDDYLYAVERFIDIQKYIYEESELKSKEDEKVKINYINTLEDLKNLIQKLDEDEYEEKIEKAYIDCEAINLKDTIDFLLETFNEETYEDRCVVYHYLSFSFLMKKKNYKKYFFKLEKLCSLMTNFKFKKYEEIIIKHYIESFVNNSYKCESEILENYLSYYHES